MQTGTSGSSCDYSFAIIVCCIILYRKYLVYLAKNQNVFVMCIRSLVPKNLEILVSELIIYLNEYREPPHLSMHIKVYFLY